MKNNDSISGGKSDNSTKQQLAKKFGKSEDYINKQFQKGIKVEMQHTDDVKIAEQIAGNHISQFADYYQRLDNMEKNAEKQLQSLNESDLSIDDSIKLSNVVLHIDKLKEFYNYRNNKLKVSDDFNIVLDNYDFSNIESIVDLVIRNFKELTGFFDYTIEESNSILSVINNPSEKRNLIDSILAINKNLVENVEEMDTVGVGGYNVDFDSMTQPDYSSYIGKIYLNNSNYKYFIISDIDSDNWLTTKNYDILTNKTSGLPSVMSIDEFKTGLERGLYLEFIVNEDIYVDTKTLGTSQISQFEKRDFDRLMKLSTSKNPKDIDSYKKEIEFNRKNPNSNYQLNKQNVDNKPNINMLIDGLNLKHSFDDLYTSGSNMLVGITYDAISKEDLISYVNGLGFTADCIIKEEFSSHGDFYWNIYVKNIKSIINESTNIYDEIKNTAIRVPYRPKVGSPVYLKWMKKFKGTGYNFFGKLLVKPEYWDYINKNLKTIQSEEDKNKYYLYDENNVSRYIKYFKNSEIIAIVIDEDNKVINNWDV